MEYGLKTGETERGGTTGTARWAAVKAAVAYVILAGLWIFASSLLVDAVVTSRDELVSLEIIKGLLFVVVTGLAVYWVVRRGREATVSAEGRYRALMDNMGSAAVIYRARAGEDDFEVLEMNKAAYEVSALDPQSAQVPGGRLSEVFPGAAEAGVLDALRRVEHDGSPQYLPQLRYVDHRISGWFDAAFYRLPDGEVAAVFDDITERVEAETALEHIRDELEERVERRTAELSAANERLKELDRLKSLFIASMSHELRTPLNSIIGFTGVLLQGMAGPLDARQHDYLQRVYTSGKHLLALITDVIDISKIEAGRIEAQVSRFDLAEAVEEAVGALAQAAAAKGLVLERDVPAGVTLETDRRRLLQCMTNLLDNAVKYSFAGTVTVRARDAGGRVVLTVADRGMGIPEGGVSELFQPFSRLENVRSRQIPGTGLGLYLCRRIANDMLGGEVSAARRSGGGSRFTLTVARSLIHEDSAGHRG